MQMDRIVAILSNLIIDYGYLCGKGEMLMDLRWWSSWRVSQCNGMLLLKGGMALLSLILTPFLLPPLALWTYPFLLADCCAHLSFLTRKKAVNFLGCVYILLNWFTEGSCESQSQHK